MRSSSYQVLIECFPSARGTGTSIYYIYRSSSKALGPDTVPGIDRWSARERDWRRTRGRGRLVHLASAVTIQSECSSSRLQSRHWQTTVAAMVSPDGAPAFLDKKGVNCKIIFANIKKNTDKSSITENELEITGQYNVSMDKKLEDFLKHTQKVNFYKRVELYEVIETKLGENDTVTERPIVFYKPIRAKNGNKDVLYEKVKFYEKITPEIVVGAITLKRPVGHMEDSDDDSDDESDDNLFDELDYDSDEDLADDTINDNEGHVTAKISKRAKFGQILKSKMPKAEPRKTVIVTADDDKKLKLSE